MEIQYIRELGRSYLVVTPPSDGHFEEALLKGARASRLLKFHSGYENGEKRFYYEITGLQPLSRLWELKTPSEQEIKSMFSQLAQGIEQLEEQMLSEKSLWLSPEQLYLEPERQELRLCVIPGREAEPEEELRELLLYLLKEIKLLDEAAILLCYRLFAAGKEARLQIRDLIRAAADSVRKERPDGKPDYAGTELCFATGETEAEAEESFYPDSFGRDSFGIASGSGAESAGDVLFPAPAEGRKKSGGFEMRESDRKQIVIEEAEEMTPQSIGRGALFKALLPGLALLLAVPPVIFFLRGAEALLRVLPGLLVIELAVFLYFFKSTKKRLSEEWNGEEEEEKEAGSFEPAGRLSFLKHMREESGETAGQTYKPEESCKPCGTALSFAEEYECSLEPIGTGTPAIRISGFPFTIGSDRARCDFVLPETGVSGLHARLEKSGDRILLTDLNSERGTRIGRYTLNANEQAELSDGAELRFGLFRYIFQKSEE